MRKTLAYAFGAVGVCFPTLLLADVTATVNGTSNVKTISSLIYGSDQTSIPNTALRLGGNRWTAYNWENNDSNAGSDYEYQNDNFLVAGDSAANQAKPGYAMLPTLQADAASGAATILTVPMAGYVSADANPGGDVRNSGANYLSTRFKQVLPVKPGGNFSLTPDTTDNYVYEDEMVNWVNHNVSKNQQVMYDLDNEPDLWSNTHAEIHPAATTYAELVADSIAYATAIKNVSPSAMVLGGVNYGWEGYRTLQNAPDAGGRDFQTYFLQQMKAADTAAGKRLVDALDFHWYPEATGLNASNVATRVTGNDTSAGVSAARIQAPRSLWDSSYEETSWITKSSLPANGISGKAIQLLPRTQSLINANDPGMKMSISEYDYGAGNDISGGIAEADALGIFGTQGVYSANWWDLGNGTEYVSAAMRMFLNYDGKGSKFGDTSVAASVSDNGTASLYAALDSTHAGRVTLMLINKSTTAQSANLSLTNLGRYTSGHAYQFNGTSSVVNGVVQIAQLSDVTLTNDTLDFSMAPLSVTEIVLVPEPAAALFSVFGGITLLRRARDKTIRPH